MTKPVLSICIPTYNRAGLLEALLEHLLFVHDLSFETEIVIYDNASTDNTEELVRSYAERLPIRYFRQTHNVGVEPNTVASLREARGIYTVYLADDDRLIPDALERNIAFMKEHPDVVAFEVPWVLWDEDTDTDLHQFYPLEEPTLFTSDQGLDCFNFVLSNGVFPEHAIYKTEILHQVVLLTHRIFVCFAMLFRFFRYGSVCFHPDSYYRSIVRGDGGLVVGPGGQTGHMQAVAYLDRYRGGLESGLLSALQEVAPMPIPFDVRAQALKLINDFMVVRMQGSWQLCLGQKDFIAAHEFFSRRLMWLDEVSADDVLEWESKYLALVGLQSLVEIMEGHTRFDAIVMCDFSKPENILPGFEYFSQDIRVEIRSAVEATRADDREKHLYLVETPECRQQLLDAGLLSGHVFCLEHLMDQYRILPRRFAN